MKKSLLKFTAPALAIGLMATAQGSALAENPLADAKAKTEVKVEQSTVSKSGADVIHRLNPIEKRISAAASQLTEITSDLEEEKTLSYKEYFDYQEQLNAVFEKLGASTNQLQAVAKKSDEHSAAAMAVKFELNAAFESAVKAQSLLESVDVNEEAPETEEQAEFFSSF
ncbi:hypothetical protein [Planococcus shenhongbingii]|uniref:Uncharacterized protein n=1 Tax=Planococcus shenhongbingii TaxID=3058398 RepID=A0ABT8NGB0_9BACL|nr:hypothetical protein [Planococcus sp. N017]MDN7246927.1 hypothetical protein [Planococcus sp. N017]